MFAERRVAQFIGRRPGASGEGAFTGLPGDTPSARCLEPVGGAAGWWQDPRTDHIQVRCPAVSVTVLGLEPSW